MVSLDKLYRTLVQEGCQDKGYYVEQEFYMTRLDLAEESTQSG